MCFFHSVKQKKIKVTWPEHAQSSMPKQIFELKAFLDYARREDARAIRIINRPLGGLKFQLRCSRYLYTLVIEDAEKAQKVKGSISQKLIDAGEKKPKQK